MACFDDIISLKELCEAITPESGFYLNDIGISKRDIEDIITSEYSSVQDFITSKSAFAISQVQADIYARLSPKYKANSVLAGSRIGHPADTKELITQSGYMGVEIKMQTPDSFTDFVISDISLFVDVTATVPVLIYDVKQGKLLQTINIDAVAGEIVTSYEKAVIPAPRRDLHLWMGYNAAAINSYKTLSHAGCSTCTGFTFNNRYIRATGASNANPWTYGSLDSQTHTAGISFNYSVNCNHRDWLCNHRQLLGSPILYRTGMEIMVHALLQAMNARTVNVTTSHKESIESKLAFYNGEYSKSMSNILNNMQVPNDRNCFHCSHRAVSLVSLPS